MNTYKINNLEYYMFDDVVTLYPGFKKDCKTPTNVIDDYNVDKNEYEYARFINKTWKITNGNNKKIDKFFITKKWFDDNFNGESSYALQNNIEKAPMSFELDDNKKFVCDVGHLDNIEMRGDQTIDKCYFKADDVSVAFELPCLHGTIINEKTTYEENIHYKYFKMKNGVKKLFLTYDGLVLLLFIYRNESVDKFKHWASKILFTVQIGDDREKIKLASNLLGIDDITLKSLLKTRNGTPYASRISYLYLFTVGPIKNRNLRTKFNIDEEDCIATFGATNKLSRFSEHIDKHGNDIELLIFEYVDDKLLVKAEALLKNYLRATNARLITDGEDEIVVINKESLTLLEDHCRMIGMLCRGKVGGNINIVKDLIRIHEKKISDVKHKNDIMMHELKHEKELAARNLVLSQKNHEYLKLKIELMEMKLKNQ